MSNLTEIEHRHDGERWKDVLFIGFAVLLTALSIGIATSQVVGKPLKHEWTVTVVESNVEAAR